MTVQIPIVITTKPDGFKKVGDDAEKLNQKLNAQAKERLRILELQAQKERATSTEVKRSIQAEISARRRALQITKIKEQAEKANTRELKQQIAAQKRLNALTKRLNRSLDEQQQKRTLLSRIQGAGAGAVAAVGAVAVVGAGILAFRRESIELSKIQAQAEAQLAARLKSTGGAAGLTADELKKMASELQATTNIGDEATISAQAMLLSFTNIGEKAFPRTTRAVLDVATAMNSGATPSAEQLKNTAIQLGKALNDPEKGLSALTRVGIVFTDQQKEQIKTLTESGKVFKAQSVILAELERQFGGSAEAAREADKGAIALSNSFGDLKENIGGLLELSVLQNESLIATVDAFSSLTGKVKEFNNTSEELIEIQLENANGLGKTLRGFSEFLPFVSTLTDLIVPLILSEEQLAEAQRQLTDEQEAAGRVVDELTEATETNTEATDAAAAAQEEAAKRLEKLNDIRSNFAGDILDIEDKSNEARAEAAKSFIEDSIEAQQQAADTIKELEEDAAKERVSIGQNLIRDLARVNSALAKDKSKIAADANKRIKRLEEDTARNTKQDDRKRRIDTLGDERLFQFDLRQLAADGEALRIQEAIERRKIEQEIGSQKRTEEGRAEGEDLDVKIQRIRQDAEDRIREEETQARDRRAALKDRAAEDLIQLNAELEEQKIAETENLAERLQALKDTNKERLANIEETKNESIAKLAEQLARSKDLTEAELNSIIPIAKKAGEDTGNAFVAGLERAFERLQEIEDLTGGQLFGGQAAPRPGQAQGAFPGQMPGFTDGVLNFGGGLATVGEGGPEQVFLPQGSSVIPSGGINVNTTVNVQGGGSVAQIEAIVDVNIQKLVTDLESAIGS